MEYIIPPTIVANQADWTLLDFSGIQQSPLSGAIRTVSRGQRWQAHLLWHDLVGDDRASLTALIAVIRGKSNRMWFADPTYNQRGSFPAPEMLNNGSFQAGATGWTVAGTGTILGYNRTLSLRAADSSAVSVYQSVSLVAGAAYALRACIIDGPTSAPMTVGVVLADASTTYPVNGRGLVTSAAVAAASGPRNQLVISIQAGAAAGMIELCSYASLRRCALAINPGAATYYSSIPVDALPPSTAGLLRAGDRVEVNAELKTVTFDLNSDAGGLGQLMFEPALRKLVPDNCPVIIGEPLMRGILSADAVKTSRPGGFSDFDLTFVEA